MSTAFQGLNSSSIIGGKSCMFPGCTKQVYSDRRGQSDFCSRSHRDLFKSGGGQYSGQMAMSYKLCKIQGCGKMVYDALTTNQGDYCSRTHRDAANFGPTENRNRKAGHYTPGVANTASFGRSGEMYITGTYHGGPTSMTYNHHQQPPPYPPPAYTPKRAQIFFYHKHDKYYEFTNFSRHKVVYKYREYPTSEHLFQAFKFMKHRPDVAEYIRTYSPYPSQALDIARKFQTAVRKDWFNINISMMDEVLYRKFIQHAPLKKMLLSTGDAELIEDADKDSFWGIGANKQGRNELGKALERLRSRFLVDEES